jgi:hypothetical protein
MITFVDMVRDEDTYPIETVVRVKKTGQFAIIKKRTFLKDEKNFLHYLAIIEDRGPGLYCIMHDEVDLECLPPE